MARAGAVPFWGLLGAVLAIPLLAGPAGAQQPPPQAVRQIEALLAEKAQRTRAQRKVSSQLLDAGRETPERPTAGAGREAGDTDAPPGLVTVDIRADVTPEVLSRIRDLGGMVVNSVPRYRSIRAHLPPAAVEPLAKLDAVRTIRPADKARTRGQTSPLPAVARSTVPDTPVTRKEDTSEGDVAHRAKSARSTHKVDGTGIGIGVISDGVRSLADRQASGDVPARVTVLPGEEGEGDEGTALLEIVHDLAPGAELYFATGYGGEARMAENIEALCEAGANVIVDDIGYSEEAVFQDGIIAGGVNRAVADGCFFFSAGGNDGNLTNGTSGVWEGDYAAGSTLVVDGETVGARHDFGGGVEANAVSSYGEGAIVLQWADPLGASTNDYDLFLINDDGDVVESSTNTQDGTQDPIESIPQVDSYGLSLVVVRVSGMDRYLRVQTFGGRLAIATAGNMYGHPAVENAIGVAMVDVRTAAGTGGVFNGNESVRRENSDGPRRIFFQPDGTAITAGNFSSTGGQLLKKPDLAAATCVTTATPGFSTFCGTSSAAPHAAAIAALMLEAAGGPNQVTLAQLRTGMTTGTAVLDIEATGVDRDSGAGIVMAPGAVDAVDAAVADRNRAPTVENAESDRTLTLGDNAVDIDLEDVFDDPDDDTLTYEAISSDPDRLTITRSNAQVTITPVSPGRVVVRLRAIDPDGLNVTDSFSVTVTAGNRDYDTDDDGLIDVADLAQLDALRYDLNGDGLVDGATWMPYYDAYPMGALGMGCPPTGGCIGYELTANLDFDTDGDGDIDSDDTYWNEGKGWLPIGNADDPFIVRFYGNGHSLTNLFINRPDEDEIGLFGQLGPVPGLFADEIHSDAGFDILDVGLIGVDISGRDKVGSLAGRADDSETRRSHASGRVAGRDRVGGLVGDSDSGVWQSYAAVKVSGRNSVGGLIGSQATIKAANLLNHSRIGSCYATGDVSGANAVGGLVGSSGTSIWAAYATGNVSGTGFRQMGASECELGGGGVGGLVGNACYYPRRYGGHIFASYATGMVSGSVGVGGLVGTTHSEVVLRGNYWDMEASGVRVGVGEDDSNENGVIDGTESHSIGLAGRTTAVLQAPTDYKGIYETWNLDVNVDGEPDAPWHFGTSSQYPALTADLNRNRSATWQEFGYQVRGGLTLTAAATEGQAQVVLAWTQVSTSSWSPAPDVTYTLVRDDGTTEEAVEKGATALRYTDTDVTTGATYTYRVTALLDGGEAIRSAPVSVIAGEGNQPPVAVGILEDLFLRVGAGTGTVALSGAFRDPESDTLTYEASSSETAVATVTSSAAQLTITPVAAGRAGITVTATDSAGSNHSATQRFMVTVWPANAVDYDTDDDNLIEIGNLAQLDAVRHDLDGDGKPTARRKNSYERAFPNAVEWMGCSLSVGCRGYELTVDLEFDTNGNGAADAADEYWNGGTGWVPIGGAGSTLDAQAYTVKNPFTANFEGNGHTVSHLFIGTDTILLVGLFGFTGSSSNIRNLGLIDVDVSGPELAAGLVGLNRGKIRGSYVTGRVSGIHNVGGLVGINNLSAEIRGSYATSHVSGDDDVGGLVGDNRGEIVASYATGRAVGNTDVGGLVGNHKSTGEISAGYATGTVSGGSNVGGLIGLFEGGSINASYWDKQTSGHATGVLPFGRTTAQLQSPTSYSSLYGSWNLDINGDSVNDDPWDFGTSSQYPALRADRNGDGDATWEEFGNQLREGPSLTASRTPGMAQVSLTWTAPVVSHWMPSPTVTYTLTRDDGTTLETLAKDLSGLQYTDTGVTPGATYHYQVAASVSGGEAARSARVSVTVTDNTPPAVSTVAITSDPGTDGIYAADDKIGVTVTFSEPVVVTGRPRLTLDVGGEDRTAEYEIGTGTAALLFAYEVDEDDEDDDGVSIAADQLRLNGGTIRDRANNAAVLTHRAVTTQSGHRVDGVRPKLVSTGGAVANGETLTLTFDEPLDGSSTPGASAFTATGGDASRTVTGVALSGSAALLTLDPAVEHGETGLRVSYTVPTGTGASPLQDVLGNDANRLSNLPVTNETPDTTPPAVSNLEITSDPGSDRTYAMGDDIRVTVTFSETVEVAGRPRLRLELGGGNRTATYGGGSGTAALVFEYEVAGGESDTDGVGVEGDGLSGGTIRDEAQNDAVLDHDGLAADSGHRVDGVKPRLAASGGAVVDGTALTLTYDEPLDGGSRPETGDFTVAGGDQARTVTGVRVNGSAVVLTLDVGAEHLETGIRVSYTPGTNPIRDVPGNQAVELSRQSVTNETPDTTPPEAESLGITSNPGSDRTYAAEDEIEVTVTFSETVEVEGTPQLRLRVGSRTRTAGYLGGSGTAVLVFGYEVSDGDEDTDGVSIEVGRIALNGGTIEDEAENAAELGHEAVAAQAGHQVDGVRPAFVSAAVEEASLTLTYGEALDGGSRPASGDFTVEVEGSGRSVSGVSISGSVVTLFLNPAVEHGDTGVRVSYTVPTGAGANPIRDAAGNNAQGLINRSVTNTTGALNTAPEITSPSSFDVPENQALARRLAARDTDSGDEVTGWAIVGGADRFQFSIAPDTGELSFRTAPDYEDPGDNQYAVRVEVTSGAGTRELTAEQTFAIRVTDEREPPEAPEAPAISGETAESLQVSWSEPDNTGPAITDYDVQYRKEGAGGFTGAPHQGTGRTLTLSDLEAGTLYQVQVRATNEEGTSGWSDAGEGMTVTPLTVEMASGAEPPVSEAFTVRFSFSEPVTGFSRSDIETGQDPACTDDQNNPVFCDPVIGGLETTDDRVFTTTVTPWTDRVAHSYTLRLTVGGDAVRSLVGSKPNQEPEEPLEVRVSPPGVEEPISSIGFQASSGSGSVRLSWNRPTDNGGSPIIRYEYRYAATGEAWSQWEKVGAGSSGVTVGGLIDGREYVFEVRAVNALGKGAVETAMAVPERRIAPPPPPGGGGGGGLLFPPEAPAALTALPGDGTVRLEWSPPENDGGSAVLRYEYRLKEGRGELGEWTPIPDSAVDEANAAGFTVMDLGNGTVHVFELRAVNAAGAGQGSEAVEVRMRLDPAYWSNFRAEDLEGARLMLEAFLSSGSSGDRELRFGEGLRFEEDELDGEGEVTETRMGGYGYRYTSRTTGELGLDFDEGEACDLRLTFTGEGTGSYVYRCGGTLVGQGSFELSELVNRVPEITSTGPFEVEENRTRVAQLEAVDWDAEDEVTGYGIAGGADGGLFRVEAETGELSFRQAPDYENPGDVESEEPASPAGDNEYVVVVEVRSGEGERERSREQAIRVRVRDLEMEEAGEDEMGEEGTESLFIPVILSSAGRNQSFFTSELTLTNRGEQEARLDYAYTSREEPENRSGKASDVLPAGRQKIETDALTYLRGLGVPIPETGNQLGTLRVEVPLGSEVEAVVRTTTMVSEGRAGLAYLGVAEEEGFEEAVYLCGLRQNSQDRSNVAFQNMGAPEEGAITLKTTVYSGEAADASPRVLKEVKLMPGEFHQYNQVLDVLGSTANGYVKVERVEGTAPFYAYGVINDQANSDGSFIFPVTASSLAERTGQTLPVIVETNAFRSELTVTNFSEEARKLDFQFVADGIEAAGNTAVFSMTLEVGQQHIIAEVVEELRRQGVAGLGSTRGFYAGPLFVVAEGGDMSGIVIGARTGSEGGGGSYSVFYNAVPFGEAFSREAWVDGLQQNQENRSNLALVNTGEVDESPSVFHLEIYDGETGLLAETVVTKPVPARRWHQINGILGRASPETRQGYIRIEKVSGENPFLAYGVVNDGGAPGERSGDGAYLPARE